MRAAVAAPLALALVAGATLAIGARLPEAATALRVARCALLRCGHAVARDAVVLCAARGHRHDTQANLLIRSAVDLRKLAVEAVARYVVGSVRGGVAHDEVETNHRSQHDRAARVDVADDRGNVRVGPQATKIVEGEITRKEVKAERLADAGREWRWRDGRRRGR